MSLTNRKSGTHFLTPSAYNRFLHRLTSRRRSDSSISDAESIQSSQAEEQGVEDVKGKKTAEDPLKVVDRVHMKTGRKVELLTPLPPLKAEEKIFFSLSDYNRFLHRLTSRRSDSSMSDAQSIQSSQVEEQGSSGDCLPTQHTEGEILSSPHLKAFTFNELKIATRNFRPDSLIGEGGSGYVFRGWIDEQTFTASEPEVGMVVAVKKLPERFQGHNEWLTEVRYLGQLHHPNIVKLIGFCSDGDFLVYEYMPKESLVNHLFRSGPQSLSWATRIKVAIGVAKGLTFLHNAKSQVIHRDVKPSNILLDSDFNAKLSGFGLAMDGPTGDMTEVFTHDFGTQGYAAPEYIGTGCLSAKVDVYGFGMVLLELLSGRRAYDKSKSDTDGNFVDWARPHLGDKRMLFGLMETKLEGQFPKKVAHAMSNLVSLCIGDNPKLRPHMSEVLAVLEKIQDHEEIDNETAENLSNLNLQKFRAERDPKFHLGQLKRFSLQELRVATDSFSNKNILGIGGFGKVYKGRLTDGSLVAVKRLHEERTKREKLQFQMEVEMISMAVHWNLLRLRGFCMTPTEWLLVYPYMANGSVASCLRERPPSEPPLDWPTRRRVALGSAHGLSYLHGHCDPKIIHCDVKAANILLDEEFEAVVGDFSLAILMDCKDTHVTTEVRGTNGHIAPEYLSAGECSEKIDVFGYGIMLLELITGQRTFDLDRLANDDDVMLRDWVKKGLLKERTLEMLVDPELQNNYVEPEVESLIQVALLCTQGSPIERPKMSEVIRMLEGDGLVERWEEWQKVGVREEVEMAPRYSEWVLDSTDNLHAFELSGPR